MEWAIGQPNFGRENFVGLRTPMHGIDLTNSGFRMVDASILAANAGKDVEFFYFFVDGEKYKRQLSLA
jgi:hypothetical protein